MIPSFFANRLSTIPFLVSAPAFSLLLCGWLNWAIIAPVYSDPVLDKAAQLLQNGRADSAMAVYQAYLKTHPRDLDAELALANIAIRRFEYDKAKRILENTLAQHPNSAETAATLGRLFQLWQNSPTGKVADNSRDYQALADEHFRQALTLDKNNPLVLTYAADWNLQKNDLITAEQYLQTALRENPSFIPAFQGLTRFYIKVKDLRRAKDTIFHATELAPLDSANYFLTAQLLGIANQPVEAVKYGLKSEQLDYGRLPERDYFLATQFEKLGETRNAIQYYESLTVYTPREPQVWLKLGELYEAANQPTQSLHAFQKALALKPDVLNDLYASARQNTRLEKIELALQQWRRLLTIQPDHPETVDEGLSAISGLHYLHHFYHPELMSKEAGEDLQRVEAALRQNPGDLKRQLDRLKIQIAQQEELSETVRGSLSRLSAGNDDAIAGEAAFILGDFAKTAERLEPVDGLSESEYAQLADRLLLVQELQFSKVFYQRAYQLKADADYQAGIKRIQSKQALATQKANEGNMAFNEKDYQSAVLKYLEAARIYQQWDNVYLRLGDTYEKLKKWPEAKNAYQKAISLSPGLMNSQGFAKNYNRLQKKAKN
ncbi:tetratricopeptide repeat protein [Vampirovibrio sp.]|uniref:tetratricopeptide repeat protein n=1 Tax=Vampirovibrio sp. TaxID=2717857 RepID=UPI003593DBF7